MGGLTSDTETLQTSNRLDYDSVQAHEVFKHNYQRHTKLADHLHAPGTGLGKMVDSLL